MFKPVPLSAAIFAVFTIASPASAQEACASITDNFSRLACYDAWAEGELAAPSPEEAFEAFATLYIQNKLDDFKQEAGMEDCRVALSYTKWRAIVSPNSPPYSHSTIAQFDLSQVESVSRGPGDFINGHSIRLTMGTGQTVTRGSVKFPNFKPETVDWSLRSMAGEPEFLSNTIGQFNADFQPSLNASRTGTFWYDFSFEPLDVLDLFRALVRSCGGL